MDDYSGGSRATRALVLVVALCPLLGLALWSVSAPASLAAEASASGTFDDDDGNIHEGMIEAIFAEGITGGCGAAELRRYCPSLDVSRGAMASFLARALDLPDATIDYFDDDDGSTHEASINEVTEAGIANGTGERTYSPRLAVTRAQMASFLARAFDLEPSGPSQFDDVSGVHEENVNAIAEAGITAGCDSSGRRYCPDAPVRRDQMATFLGRALGLAPIDPSSPTTTTTSSTTTSSTTTSSTTTTTTAPPILNYSLPPRYGSTALTSGFVPDPFTVGVTGGGPVNVSYLGGGCGGHANQAPDFSVNYTAGAFPLLRFYFIGSADATMIINTPGGSYVCVDDSFGTLNPTIDFNAPSSGRYDIWIGSYAPATTAPGTLYVTESPGNHP